MLSVSITIYVYHLFFGFQDDLFVPPFCRGAFKIEMVSWLVFFATPRPVRLFGEEIWYKQKTCFKATQDTHIIYTSPKFDFEWTNLQSYWILRFLDHPSGVSSSGSRGPPTPSEQQHVCIIPWCNLLRTAMNQLSLQHMGYHLVI